MPYYSQTRIFCQLNKSRTALYWLINSLFLKDNISRNLELDKMMKKNKLVIKEYILYDSIYYDVKNREK